MTHIYDGEMLDAYRAARHSQDPSTQNGAVLLLDQRLNKRYQQVRSFNHFPEGVDEEYWHGEKADKYARVVHAETGAIIEAAKYGCATLGSTLVCPWAACSNCAKHIVAAGIKRLVRHSYSNSGVTTGSHWYADCQIGDEIMLGAEIEIVEIEPINFGIMLRRDGKLITV